MRRRRPGWLALLVAFATFAPFVPFVPFAPGAANAQDDDDDDAGDGDRAAAAVEGRVLVPLSARWDVRAAVVPRLTAQLGPSLLGALDQARGGAVAPGVFGAPPAELPPVTWPFAVPDPIRGAAPIGAGDCACKTVVAQLAPDQRVAALWAVTHFALGADPSDAAMRVLELRVRYRDGLALWLNGVPIVRRELPVQGDPLALATRRHGPEWESFFVPVVPGLLRAGDNVLAVEVRPAAHGVAPRLELELAGRPSGRVVRGPMVQRVGAAHATLVVETDLPTRATVAWGPTAALGTVVADHRLTRRHELELADLPVDAAVHYQVAIDGVPAAAAQFATAPTTGEIIRVGVYGDVRGGHRVHAAIVAQLLDEAPDLVLASGDLVLHGADEADWQQFFAVTAPLLATIPFYASVGNHDLGRAGDLARRFTDLFALPPGPADRPAGDAWYSFDVADVHVVMLDSNAYDDALQRAWLERDLTAAARARAILVVVHDGPFARGSHGGNQLAVRDFVPILARHRVTLVISGHDHLYQRGRHDGVDYLVSGGGGAPLYRLRCGVAGRPRCAHPDGMQHGAREHHYVVLTIYPRFVEVCPKLVDGTPLEPCYHLPTR